MVLCEGRGRGVSVENVVKRGGVTLCQDLEAFLGIYRGDDVMKQLLAARHSGVPECE
jgi:hypothetical protein